MTAVDENSSFPSAPAAPRSYHQHSSLVAWTDTERESSGKPEISELHRAAK